MTNATRPAELSVAVTPSDSTDMTLLNGNFPRAFYVGVTGNVVLVNTDYSTATYTAVPAGALIPARFRRINSTSTTASSIVALY